MKRKMSSKQLERANEASRGCYLYRYVSGWTKTKLRGNHLKLKTTSGPCLWSIHHGFNSLSSFSFMHFLLAINKYFAVFKMEMTGETLHR